MNEKVYKTMSGIGGGTLAIGIVVLVTGIVSGTMLIINGARLIKKKYELTILGMTGLSGVCLVSEREGIFKKMPSLFQYRSV